MSKIIHLDPGVRIVRTSLLHRNKRKEYVQIGQGAVRRVQQDFDLPTMEAARTALLGLLGNPSARLENHRAFWTIEGVKSPVPQVLDPLSLVRVPPQIMSMLVEATCQAMQTAFVQAFADQPAVVTSRNMMEAIRSIIQYHPDEGIRTAYTFEINQLLEGIE